MNVSPRQSSRLGARVAAVAALTAAMLFPAVLGAPSVSAEPEKPRGAAHGYVLVTADGTAYPFGDAGLFGENQNQGPDISATGSTADGGGYWMVDEDGDIFAYGDATHYGSRADNTRNVVGLAPRPEGDGYWMAGTDGGVFAFGGAPFYGSAGGMPLKAPVVGMASTPSGRGYWLVAMDGGIFSYGDADFYGSTGALMLNRPIVGMASTPSGRGYWLVASDGGIFSYGDAEFFGSTGAIRLNRPIVGMASTGSGSGYWLVASDGGIFTYGDAAFLGSAGDRALEQPVIGMFALPDKVPVAVPDAVTVTEDTLSVVPVLANDTGLGDGGISVTVVGHPAQGTATATPDGTVTYAPASDYTGPDAFTYRVEDADGDAATATVGITVVDRNDRPRTSDRTMVVTEDGAATGQVTATDIDGDTLSFRISTPAGHGTAAVNPRSGMLTYSPAQNYHGQDSFVVTVDDGRGGTDTSFIAVTVTAVNDPPVAVDQAVTVDEDAVAAGTVTATDADADILTYGLGTAPAGGTATVDPTTGAYTYTPGPDYNGSDSFTVTVSDGRGGTDTSTVTLTVTALNDAPTISGLAESYVGTPQSELIAFRVGDVDVGQGLAVTVESSNESFVPTTSANLQLADLGSGDWTLIVVPEVGVAGTSWITVSVTDGTATSTATFLFEVI